MQIRHPKSGARGWVPLEHVEAAKTVLLHPVVKSYLKDLPKLDLPSFSPLAHGVHRDPIPAKTPSVAFEAMSAAMHKSPGALRLYVKSLRPNAPLRPSKDGYALIKAAGSEAGECRPSSDLYAGYVLKIVGVVQ